MDDMNAPAATAENEAIANFCAEMLAKLAEFDRPRIPGITLRAVLKTLCWSEGDLAELLQCEEERVRRWTVDEENIPDRVSEWLETLATWHVTNPPPKHWRR